MKNRILKIVVYLAVYVACVILFSRFAVIQRQQTVSASDLEDPTLPVMCVDVSGYKVNRMFGYYGWEMTDFRYGKDIRLYDADAKLL